MEPVEYMSPDGRTELVADPAHAVRIRARGWWPMPELREQASVPGAAADWLARAEAAAAARAQRAKERENASSEADAPPAAKKTAAKKTSG